jgi:glycosyltransferase involved in cell wall biosynthesis
MLDSQSPSVSVIITNYNYAKFVNDAIKSALALDWPEVEIIVVDDGSTDGSQNIIKSFGSKIKSICFEENRGQHIAYNVGFQASMGDLIIFLDADDILMPSIINEAVAVWTPNTSKAQVQMMAVDSALKPTGSIFPQFNRIPSSDEIRRWAIKVGAYPTPCGSGDIYARHFLQKIFPLDDCCGPYGDSCCIVAAPFLGDVQTVAKPLVLYRVHGNNVGAFTELTHNRFRYYLERGYQRFEYGKRIAKGAGYEISEQAIKRSLHLLPYRLAAFRLDPPSSGTKESAAYLTFLTFVAALTPQGYPARIRAALAIWGILVAWLPITVARRLVIWRFVPVKRPSFVKSLLQRISIMQQRSAD